MAPVALALIAGIVVGLRAPVPWWVAWLVGLFGFGAARRSSRNRWLAHTGMCVAVAAIGLTVLRLHQWLPSWHIVHRATETPRVVVLRGVIVEDPAEGWTAWGEFRTTAVIQVSAVRDGEAWFSATGLVRATFAQRDERFRYGDALVVEGEVARPRRHADASFDWPAYLARQGIYATLRVQAYRPALLLRRDQGQALWRWAFRARAWARRLLTRSLDGASSGVLRAMLLGDRAGLTEDQRDAFLKTGTIHILSVSGLHVGMLAALVLGAVRVVRLPVMLTDALVLAWLMWYAVLTGGRVPVVRATIMAATWLVGRRVERDVGLVQLLSLAAVVVLLWQPQQLSDPGFQLSFGSVLAIALVVPVVERWPHHLQAARSAGRSDTVAPGRRPVLPVVGGLRSSLLVSLGCWIGIAPLIAWHYRLIAPITILANLFVIPLLSVILALGLLLLTVGGWGGWLATMVAMPLQWCLRWLMHGVAWMARVPGGWWLVTPAWWWLVPAYLGLAVWLALDHRRCDLTVR